MPQIRKFYVFFVLLVVYSTFRKISEIRAIVLLWAGVATLSALRSLFQFWRKYQQAAGAACQLLRLLRRLAHHRLHEPLDDLRRRRDDRAAAAGGVSVLFARERRWKTAGWLCAVHSGCLHGARLHAQHLPAGLSRSDCCTCFGSGSKWLVAAVPVVALLAFSWWRRVRQGARHFRHSSRTAKWIRTCIAPSLRETGMVMIRAHPWLGLGPEQVKHQFEQWVPADVALPLAGRLLRAPAQHLSAVRGRARHSRPCSI